MRLYHSVGHAYFVCPELLELDPRHGEHWSKWSPCRRGLQCPKEHDHEPTLLDPEGHTVNDFHWFPGCRPPIPGDQPSCLCGRDLVFVDLDDPHDPKHVLEVDDPADFEAARAYFLATRD